MPVSTAAGTTLSISASQPATLNEAGYDTLFTTVTVPPFIAEIVSGIEFGRVYQEVKHNPIGSRGTQKFKGSYDEGSVSLELAYDTDDAGQTIAYEGVNSDADYSFMASLPDGTRFFFQAKIMSFKVKAAGVDSMVTATIDLSITTSSGGVGIVQSLPA